MESSADEIVQPLGLEPHPTCGFAALTCRVAGSELRRAAREALLGTSEWGAFAPSELALGHAEELGRPYPALRDWPA